MTDANFRDVLHGIAAVLSTMRTQHIVNVASDWAHSVDPSAAAYCSTSCTCTRRDTFALSKSILVRAASTDQRAQAKSPPLELKIDYNAAVGEKSVKDCQWKDNIRSSGCIVAGGVVELDYLVRCGSYQYQMSS